MLRTGRLMLRDVEDVEKRWMLEYWRPLGRKEYDVLASRVERGPGVEQGPGANLAVSNLLTRTRDVKVGREGSSSGTMTEASNPQVLDQSPWPVYVPTLSVLTWLAKRHRRRTRPSVFNDKFLAYRALHDSIPEPVWWRMRTVGLEHFARCALAYVELGAIISYYYLSPYGLVGSDVGKYVAKQLRSNLGSRKPRNWIVGCLLQHAQAPLEKLIEFCTAQLEFNPAPPVQNNRQLECIKRSASYFARRGTCPKKLLRNNLRNLPTVTIAEFALIKSVSVDGKSIATTPARSPSKARRQTNAATNAAGTRATGTGAEEPAIKMGFEAVYIKEEPWDEEPWGEEPWGEEPWDEEPWDEEPHKMAGPGAEEPETMMDFEAACIKEEPQDEPAQAQFEMVRPKIEEVYVRGEPEKIVKRFRRVVEG
ncbi:hypothetical protein GNI_074220 [Gregarina niphandrodes]|uniref:Uncharacterized protein n=1 Tax=Gregarina niphandrodes TaxID=110365 RepID=A0A023B6Z8_GRENI|nr:hypothetical protein GNI_074220 [Gregarina niphandrodes]EZG66896.1 hypothetical protein GNI_074220 [Gregarina niphandrodes]|eukprot:XP_011130429.1 hypothetical protein GNI_074220 [Gregarina niphandrodes]